VKEISEITGYHAHVYFDVATRDVAERVRKGLGETCVVELGTVHDKPVGPHSKPMFQAAFATDQFDKVVPWLMLNRDGLSILVHPITGQEIADHTAKALWLGDSLPIDVEFLRQFE
jgi:DOPA 4,5-dioxygenase